MKVGSIESSPVGTLALFATCFADTQKLGSEKESLTATEKSLKHGALKLIAKHFNQPYFFHSPFLEDYHDIGLDDNADPVPPIERLRRSRGQTGDKDLELDDEDLEALGLDPVNTSSPYANDLSFGHVIYTPKKKIKRGIKPANGLSTCMYTFLSSRPKH